MDHLPPHPTGLFGYLSPRLSRVARQFPRLPQALALVWTSARRWTIAWAALLVAQGVLPVAIVWLTRPLVNSVLAAIRTGGNFRPALFYSGLMAAVLLATEALRGASSWVRTAQSELVRNHISQLVQEKSAAVDLGFYETPEFFDHLHRARAEAATVPLALIENLGGLAQNGITLIAMAGVLTMFGIGMPLALFAGTLPALYVVLRYAARQYQWSVRTTQEQRRADYYEWVLTEREHAAELRLFHLAPCFRSRFRLLRDKLSGERIELARKESFAEFGAGAAGLGIGGLALLWMGSRAIQGKATAGDLALFYQAFQQGMGLMRTLLGNAGQIYRNSLYLEGLFDFLDLEPSIHTKAGATPVPDHLTRGISFHDVTFRYPGTEGSDRTALNGFSLEARAGEILAVVGENGAGKSTLIKLLCRFYDPDSGRVELDGHDLRDLPVDELRSRIAVLFQEPARYHATVAANIAPGETADAAAIGEAAHAAGVAPIVAKLPQGYESMLGRWFEDGAELSTGEWQRIALARAFLRAAPILALDEPTSAMDPWAEADWLRRFRKLAQGRTAILITHRFTTARVADRIALMAAGRVIEYGTHEELLAHGGRYAAGWNSQVER